MFRIEMLEQRVHLSVNPVMAAARATPSIDIAVSSVASSFGSSSMPGAKAFETLAVQNLGGMTAHGRILFGLSIADSNGDYYVLRVIQPTRTLSLRPGASKTFRLHVALPSLPNASDYVITGNCNVESGFTDPEPDNNGIDFSSMPIAISSGASDGNVGYFTLSPFSATDDIGSVRHNDFYETGNVTVSPGGSVEYSYSYAYGNGMLQIEDVYNTTNNEFALFNLSILHHAPTKLNGKTLTIVASPKGESGSGSLIEEGFAVPGLSWTEQVAYYKLT